MIGTIVVEKDVEYRVQCPACYKWFIMFVDDISDATIIGCPNCSREIKAPFFRIVKMTREELKVSERGAKWIDKLYL